MKYCRLWLSEVVGSASGLPEESNRWKCDGAGNWKALAHAVKAHCEEGPQTHVCQRMVNVT